MPPSVWGFFLLKGFRDFMKVQYKHKNYSQEEKEKIYNNFLNSNLSSYAYCNQNKIPYSTFYRIKQLMQKESLLEAKDSKDIAVRSYSSEDKKKAIKGIFVEKKTIASYAKENKIPKSTVAGWIKSYKSTLEAFEDNNIQTDAQAISKLKLDLQNLNNAFENLKLTSHKEIYNFKTTCNKEINILEKRLVKYFLLCMTLQCAYFILSRFF